MIRIPVVRKTSPRGTWRLRREADFQIHPLEKAIFVKRKNLDRYIVADPTICHGKPTFRGTRIMVWQILDQIANGMSWDTIVEEWRGNVTKKAIAEAVRLSHVIQKESFYNSRQLLETKKILAE